MNQINVKLIQRNDTFENWESVNPVLSVGEIGVDTTNNKIKIGDGTTPWNDLEYCSNLNIESNYEKSGTGSITQQFDSGDTLDFTGKNNYFTQDDLTSKFGADAQMTSIPKGAVGNFASSLGGKSIAKGKRSTAQGTTTIAAGAYSHAEGDNSVAFGDDSHAEGYMNLSRGNASHAEGEETHAIGGGSHTEGSQTVAEGLHSHAEGVGTTATGNYSHSEGLSTKATGTTSHSEGHTTEANGANSHAEGYKNISNGANSHVEGLNTITTEDATGSHAEGHATEVRTANSHAEGSRTVAGSATAIEEPSTGEGGSSSIETPSEGGESGGSGSGETGSIYEPMETGNSHSEGYRTASYGTASHAEGSGTLAYNYNSHAEGQLTKAYGNSSHAEGIGTVAGVEGEPSIAWASHAEGSETNATGYYSHAEGRNTTASGSGAHAEGDNTTASGQFSHAEGRNTTASGIFSKTFGFGTKATGVRSVAGGYQAEANGDTSFSFGHNTKTRNANEVAFGKYNKSNVNTLFSIGDGIGDSDVGDYGRHNAFEVTDDGKVTIPKLQDHYTKSEVDTKIDEMTDKISNVYTKTEADLPIERIKYYDDPSIIPSNISYFTVNDSGETITGLTNDGKTQTKLVIPYKINGIEITAIGDYAFSETPLTNVIIPNSVTSIGSNAFYYCDSLTNISIPNSVTSIGNSAFSYCALTNISIPNGVTSIGASTFNYCESLKNVTIPNSVTSIDNSAFYQCVSLTSINIPNSVTSIGDDVFHIYDIETSSSIPIPGLTLYCEQGSYAETYAKANNISIMYTDISAATIDAKANSDDVYTKTEIDSKVSSVYRYKGTIENYTSLPTSGLTVGDVYNIENAIYPTVSTKYAMSVAFDNAYTTGSESNLTYVYQYIIGEHYTHLGDSTEFYVYVQDKKSGLYEAASVSFTDVEVTELTTEDPDGNVEVLGLNVTFKITDSSFEKYNDYASYGELYIQEVGSETDSTKGTAIRVADDIMKARVNAGDNVAWTGSEWDILAGTVDLSNYAKKSTTLAGYGITNAYTKTEVNKAITEVDGKLGYIETAKMYLGDELMTEGVCGSNWSGSNSEGFTHTTGSTEDLTFPVTTTSGGLYLFEFDTTYSSGEFCNVGFGDVYKCLVYNGTNRISVFLYSDGGDLKITPYSTFSGTISNFSLRPVQEEGGEVRYLEVFNTLTDNHTKNFGMWNTLIGNNVAENGYGITRTIAIGKETLSNIKAGNRNIAIGTFAMQNVNGGEANISIGPDSMQLASEAENSIAIGKASMCNGKHIGDIAIGDNALKGDSTSDTNYNIAIGSKAGYYNQKNGNVFIGTNAGYNNRTGYRNIALGGDALKTNRSGHDNIAIGNTSNVNDGCSNSIVIGKSITATKSNQMILGDSAITEVVICGNKKLNFNTDGTVTWEEIS